MLDELVGRGLCRPRLLITDGASGLERALTALWPDVPAQRCAVHTIRTQSTIRLVGRPVPAWPWAARGDDMADLQAAVADDDALDDELQDRLLVGERRCLQAPADAGAERFQAGADGSGRDALLAQAVPFLSLALEPAPLLGQAPAPL
jgi:hypothetical protein